jgi:hypothetical protein
LFEKLFFGFTFCLKQLTMFDHFKMVVSYGICLAVRKIELSDSRGQPLK